MHQAQKSPTKTRVVTPVTQARAIFVESSKVVYNHQLHVSSPASSQKPPQGAEIPLRTNHQGYAPKNQKSLGKTGLVTELRMLAQSSSELQKLSITIICMSRLLLLAKNRCRGTEIPLRMNHQGYASKNQKSPGKTGLVTKLRMFARSLWRPGNVDFSQHLKCLALANYYLLNTNY